MSITSNDFKRCCPHVLSVEGGYSNNPNDTGGPTMRGIAWNHNQGILKQLGYTRDTIQTLTKEHAEYIYFVKYWSTVNLKIDNLNDLRLKLLVFDTAVNQGLGAANKLLSKLSYNPIYFEGKGKNEHLFLILTFQYFVLRMLEYSFYKQWSIFGMGWIRRIGHIGKVIVDWSLKGEHRK